MVSSISRTIATTALFPERKEPSDKDTAHVRVVLESLQHGTIDRALFSANANSYFNAQAIEDYKKSLGALGKLKNVTAAGENLRGGMTHRTYRAEFEKKTLTLNIYLLEDGKFEQFMAEGQ
jgi:D-alanyl-D-alanine carboxypeptidase